MKRLCLHVNMHWANSCRNGVTAPSRSWRQIEKTAPGHSRPGLGAAPAVVETSMTGDGRTGRDQPDGGADPTYPRGTDGPPCVTGHRDDQALPGWRSRPLSWPATHRPIRGSSSVGRSPVASLYGPPLTTVPSYSHYDCVCLSCGWDLCTLPLLAGIYWLWLDRILDGPGAHYVSLCGRVTYPPLPFHTTVQVPHLLYWSDVPDYLL